MSYERREWKLKTQITILDYKIEKEGRRFLRPSKAMQHWKGCSNDAHTTRMEA